MGLPPEQKKMDRYVSKRGAGLYGRGDSRDKCRFCGVPLHRAPDPNGGPLDTVLADATGNRHKCNGHA